MASAPIYLDHNATTPVLPEVLEAMLPYFSERFGNPSSQHPYGREAREAVDRARGEVAAAIDATPEEIVFTSGGTESNNLAIFGASRARPYRHHVVTSAVEHPAIREPLGWLERQGTTVDWLHVDASGRVSARDAERVVTDRTLMVTVMHANNETGSVQPIAQLSELARASGALAHSDAAQSLGKIPLSVRALGVDLLTIAGHKVYAPKGVGALYVRQGCLLSPFALGASHERGLRPGTEAVPAIVALGRACAIAAREVEAERRRLLGLASRLFERLRARVAGLALNGPALEDPERLPNTLSVRFPGVTGVAVLERAPSVAASTGSACHQGEVHAPKGIVACGVPEDQAVGTVRLSLGRLNDERQIDDAADALAAAFEEVAPR
ncbi:MAG: cysteine desulfurase [Polyangiaceae bacterium]|jgi:cysteine desulfurase|nr:cysteine desulfurase [Polyangiaceae bacterium]